MEWVENLNESIDYIEEHLHEKIDYNQVAKKACCSLNKVSTSFFVCD
ncbi:transcriptional regulator GlxA family with amidase domain [Paenibacillus anaericanus]|nr:transcriptional regulator GlxA family with amidase domain [Paenibacillus anaericanus]